jgi:hypothetical protein
MSVYRVVRPTVVLSLADVRESGRPAFFFDYGEALVYEGDEVYDVRDWGDALQSGAEPMPLPHDVLEHAVGIEYGWRHAVICDCDACAVGHAAAGAVHRAALPGESLVPLPQRHLPEIAPSLRTEADSQAA